MTQPVLRFRPLRPAVAADGACWRPLEWCKSPGTPTPA